MTGQVESVRASQLAPGDRVLLKDLRVLQVKGKEVGKKEVTLRFYELACNESQTVVLPRIQIVKVLRD